MIFGGKSNTICSFGEKIAFRRSQCDLEWPPEDFVSPMFDCGPAGCSHCCPNNNDCCEQRETSVLCSNSNCRLHRTSHRAPAHDSNKQKQRRTNYLTQKLFFRSKSWIKLHTNYILRTMITIGPCLNLQWQRDQKQSCTQKDCYYDNSVSYWK